MFYIEDNNLVREFDNEKLWIQPWGKDSFRIQSSPMGQKPTELNALLEREESNLARIEIRGDDAEIWNGDISARISKRNRIIFKNQKGEIILEEFLRQRAVHDDMGNEDTDVKAMRGFSATLKLPAREFTAKPGTGVYSFKGRFESDPKEKIYGMGQYQHHFLDLKNCSLELAHRNSQISIPFYTSSKGYGFLWNNPGIGRVSFNKNLTEWEMYSTNYLDYWITVGDTPKEITANYADVVGTAPKMPEDLLGLWQSKMRYNSQDEVLEIAHKYKEMGITPSVMVVDFFHWTEQGHFDFDETYWPDPKAMVDELTEMGIKTVISVWPTVSQNAKNYGEYVEKGLLIKTNRGMRVTMHQRSNTVFIDPTNPKTREYVWKKLEKSYYDNGIKMFWLDVAEPGYAVYDFDNYKYFKGPDLQVGNIFPYDFSRLVYDGLKSEDEDTVTLIRGAWAGTQKFGTLLWSGDIDSSFGAFRNQVNTGLNVSLAGNPWWTTDIGGFHGGNVEDPEFRELMIRWFQYATFSPILRMHGDRQPHPENGTSSGADNEIWSFGEKVQSVMEKYTEIRISLKDYIKEQFDLATNDGTPLMRPLFYDYPEDNQAWETENTYMFGPGVLVAPIMHYKARTREVYLPEGSAWVDMNSGKEYKGGQLVTVEAPLEQIPVFSNQEFTDTNTAELLKRQ